MTRYQLSLKAHNLKRGFFRRPSPYAELHFDDGPRKGQKIGRTERLDGTVDPDFVRILFFDVDPATITHVKISLYDDYGPSNDRLLIGAVVIEPTEVFQSQGHTQVLSLESGKATISVSVNESNPRQRGTLKMHLRGLDIRNVEPGLLGLGRSDPFFEISKKDADHSSGQVRWNVVYRSEHKPDHLNPLWKEFDIDLEALCNGDLNYPMRIEVHDHNKSGRHTKIGACETTVANMIENIAVKGNADRDKAFELYREGDPEDAHGQICVLKAEIFEETV